MGLRAEQTGTTSPLEGSLHAALVGIHRRFIARCYPRECPAATPDRLHNNSRNGRRVHRAGLKLDAVAHAHDPSRLAPCKRPPGDPTPRGSSVARTITPAPGLLLPPRCSTGVGLRSTSSRSSGTSRRRMRCPKRCCSSDHALVASLDGLMPCEILRLMAAAIASQPRHRAFVVRGRLICSAPSPRLFNYPFGFPEHIVGACCCVVLRTLGFEPFVVKVDHTLDERL
jgi:hypothetical protein